VDTLINKKQTSPNSNCAGYLPTVAIAVRDVEFVSSLGGMPLQYSICHNSLRNALAKRKIAMRIASFFEIRMAVNTTNVQRLIDLKHLQPKLYPDLNTTDGGTSLRRAKRGSWF
jgi:hypothetical protein